MYEVSVKTHFSAAHHLNNYPGACSEHHGHNWEVEVFVRGRSLDDTGMLLDFRDLKEALKDVIDIVDHKDLNMTTAFKNKNPTSENIAGFIYDEMSARINGNCTVDRVQVHETPGTTAVYWKEALPDD